SSPHRTSRAPLPHLSMRSMHHVIDTLSLHALFRSRQCAGGLVGFIPQRRRETELLVPISSGQRHAECVIVGAYSGPDRSLALTAKQELGKTGRARRRISDRQARRESLLEIPQRTRVGFSEMIERN